MSVANAKVQKWGNSLALRIPKAYADQIGLYNNRAVKIILEESRLIIEPAVQFDLDELLSKITPENLHGEIDTGGPVGNEVW